MDPSIEQRLSEALAGYRQKRDQFLRMQQQLSTAAATVRSRDRMVSVTVDARGQVTGLRFHTDAYRRMEPAPLAALLMETIAKARGEVREQIRGYVTPLLPRDTSFEQAVSGEIDWAKMFGAVPSGVAPDNPVVPATDPAPVRPGDRD
ncbi:YbaB/EbfC family nucleoid-associated protein [Planosporangium thailandense]|uniref:YbaB/EbfC family nucleoid-associated protein n=1 Tax=Planosporangium thailandense TaxID=765197 RepID=A0ABX0Y0Z4_9ACTN|nr:YbaB/EbfC family nucleoid-associated protein [Planosporangium thailandense]NJC72021.1 YbaB/EbfC family nucleoid-associated protein [Planosporangium thailandense]